MLFDWFIQIVTAKLREKQNPYFILIKKAGIVCDLPASVLVYVDESNI